MPEPWHNPPFSWRLFDPNGHPSYFHSYRGVGTGDPSDWQVAVLLVLLCCAVALLVVVQRRLRCGRAVFGLIVAPLVVGALGTIIQLHQAVMGLTRDWIGPAAGFEEFVFYSVYSTHLGIYGTLLLFLIYGPLYWRRVVRPSI